MRFLSLALRLPRPLSRLTVAFLIALLRFYQLTLSPISCPCCRYTPTCSNYAIGALRRHGILMGLALTLARLARCHPWSGFGFDPVPETRPSFSLSSFYHDQDHAPGRR